MVLLHHAVEFRALQPLIRLIADNYLSFVALVEAEPSCRS